MRRWATRLDDRGGAQGRGGCSIASPVPKVVVLLLLVGVWLAGCDGPAGADEGNGMAKTMMTATVTATATLELVAEATTAVSPTGTATAPQPPVIRTAVPTATSEPTVTPTSTESPTLPPTPTPMFINGMSSEEFIIMPPAVVENARAIYQRGQEIGRNPHAFSKLGDSLVVTSHYLTKFDTGLYQLGEYAYLQPVVEHFRGSYARYGAATWVGLHAWAIFDPFWANDEWCAPGEHMLTCEFRLHNPSILLIRMGTNDNGSITDFETNLQDAVAYTIEQGVIPVLGTKADRFEGDNRNNLAIRRIAEALQVPLWEFDLLANTLPNRGISEDEVHLTIMYEHDYTDPEAFERGYPVSDLSALMVLQRLLVEVMGFGG